MGLFDIFHKTPSSAKFLPSSTDGIGQTGSKPKQILKNLLSTSTKTHHISQIQLKTPTDFIILRQQLVDGNLMVIDTQELFHVTNQGQIQLLFENFKDFCKQRGCLVTKLKESLFLVTPNNQFKIDNLLN